MNAIPVFLRRTRNTSHTRHTGQRALQLAAILGLFAAGVAHAAPTLIAIGELNGTRDLSGLNGTLESGISASILGGMGSGLAWAGGNTFLALPDRGPNATAYNGGALVDNTTSYIPRFHTLSMSLTANAPGSALAYTLTPTLTSTTLMSSSTALNYGNTAGLPSGYADGSIVNSGASAGTWYFSGRSDNFSSGTTSNANNARLDPEGIRVSNDGKSVFVSDEYGPYIRQFDRNTGTLIKTFTLPANLAANFPNAVGSAEISGNTSGRVANKGMEGLAITPDGKTLVGFMQSPLAQDGGDGGRYNRIVTIDIATGATKQYAYDNQIAGKAYNSSEIVALNDHEFVVLERDGKGQGDGSNAKVKSLMKVDIAGATDVSSISGASNLAKYAVKPTTFLDIKAALVAFGLTEALIPAKMEGIAFGEDIFFNGSMQHTLWLTNDNDFLNDVAGTNRFYVFAFTDADLNGSTFQNQEIPEPGSLALMLGSLGLLGSPMFRRKPQ